MNSKTVTYRDIWFQVEYTWDDGDTRINFGAYKIISFTDHSEKEVSELGREYFIGGYVKWDFCMEFHMRERQYFSGRYMSRQFGELFERIYDEVKDIGKDNGFIEY